jgi:hypothetical protein
MSTITLHKNCTKLLCNLKNQFINEVLVNRSFLIILTQ